MKIIKGLALLFCLMFALQTNAEDGDKEVIKAFRNAKVVEVNVDMSKTQFAGLDSLSFVEYMAGKENRPVAYVSKSFHFFRLRMLEKLNSTKGKNKKQYTLESSTNADFCLDIEMEEITEKAGLQGKFYIYPKGDKEKAVAYEFSYKDGRWNSFQELLYEAAEDFAKDLALLTFEDQYYAGYYRTYTVKAFKKISKK